MRYENSKEKKKEKKIVNVVLELQRENEKERAINECRGQTVRCLCEKIFVYSTYNVCIYFIE